MQAMFGFRPAWIERRSFSGNKGQRGEEEGSQLLRTCSVPGTSHVCHFMCTAPPVWYNYAHFKREGEKNSDGLHGLLNIKMLSGGRAQTEVQTSLTLANPLSTVITVFKLCFVVLQGFFSSSILKMHVKLFKSLRNNR